jgi:hypothetical protein
VQGHREGDFFQRRIAGAFADAVDCALDDVCSSLDAGQRVGDAEAEVVVEVDCEERAVDVRDTVLQAAEHVVGFVGREDADRVREADSGGPRVDGFLVALAKESHFSAAAVFGAEGDDIELRGGVLDCVGDHRQHFALRFLVLVLPVNRADAAEQADAAFASGSAGEGGVGGINVGLERAGEAGEDGFRDGRVDEADGFDVGR